MVRGHNFRKNISRYAGCIEKFLLHVFSHKTVGAGTGGVRGVDGKFACQHIIDIVLGAQYFINARKDVGLMFFQPHKFEDGVAGGGKAGPCSKIPFVVG